MRKLFLILFPPWLFVFFYGAQQFLDLCATDNFAWWQFPLWMAGMLAVGVPAFVGGGFLILRLAFGWRFFI